MGNEYTREDLFFAAKNTIGYALKAHAQKAVPTIRYEYTLKNVFTPGSDKARFLHALSLFQEAARDTLSRRGQNPYLVCHLEKNGDLTLISKTELKDFPFEQLSNPLDPKNTIVRIADWGIFEALAHMSGTKAFIHGEHIPLEGLTGREPGAFPLAAGTPTEKLYHPRQLKGIAVSGPNRERDGM